MEEDLQTLLEKEKIIETINGLFIGTDQRDWVWVKKCFAPRVRFDMTLLTGGVPAMMTPKEMADIWKKEAPAGGSTRLNLILNTSTAI